ncbi:MAG: prepilin-type N-terminal cleavage/methylation domain-containing protein [Phycisphaerae bacterium]
MSPARSTGRCGFTLVELLVVIGIIALLISILLPSLSRAREQANAVDCSSGMRQLGVGFLFYIDENRGWLPPDSAPKTLMNYNRWFTALVGNGYVRGPGLPPQTSNTFELRGGELSLFHCKSDRTIGVKLSPTGPNLDQVIQNGAGTSYVPNSRVIGPASSAPFDGPFKIVKYRNSSERLMLTEKDWNIGRTSVGLVPDLLSGNPWNATRILSSVVGRHGSPGSPAGNVLFVDGHVEGIFLADLHRAAQVVVATSNANDPIVAGDRLWGLRAGD